MKPYYQDHHATQYCQDFRKNDLPDESVQMVCTSPPYWGLRKYSGEQDLIWGDNHCEHEWGSENYNPVNKKNPNRGPNSCVGQPTREANETARDRQPVGNTCSLCGAWKGGYGLEPTPELYVQHTIEILREIRRVLRKDGVVFWNIGDSYHGGGRGNKNYDWAANHTERETLSKPHHNEINRPSFQKHPCLKPKDLCLIPFKVAIAAQEDGWYVRSVIIWSKPNPMPESVTDRPTNSHEYILMLTKSAKYYWDADAVRETAEYGFCEGGFRASGRYREQSKQQDNSQPPAESVTVKRGDGAGGRNIRSVWEFPTQPFPEAHFAVYPEKLPEICIKAATPEVGCCSKCGAPWERVIEKGFTGHGGETKTAYPEGATANRLAKLRQAARANGGEYTNTSKTIGWQPTCKCNADKVPSVVLDPFSGAGTTLWVAKKLNRKAIGFELSEEYCKLSVKRNGQQVML